MNTHLVAPTFAICDRTENIVNFPENQGLVAPFKQILELIGIHIQSFRHENFDQFDSHLLGV
jgi:hypothetical protein